MNKQSVTRRGFMGSVAGGMAAMSAMSGAHAQNREEKRSMAEKQPNILYIMTD